jgi:hypothetical protein
MPVAGPGFLDQPLDGSVWRRIRDPYCIVRATARARVEAITLDAAVSRELEIRVADPALSADRVTEVADALEAGRMATCLSFLLESRLLGRQRTRSRRAVRRARCHLAVS